MEEPIRKLLWEFVEELGDHLGYREQLIDYYINTGQDPKLVDNLIKASLLDDGVVERYVEVFTGKLKGLSKN